MPCCDIPVVDDHGREVPPETSGELWIAGANVVPGSANFQHGYWRSGDVGSIDRDGFVRVFDREKDMINRAGYKVYSAEVENVLSHHPGIIEAAVVGRPDEVLGERVQAFIVRRDDQVTEFDIRGFCAERLSDHKVPDRITFLAGTLPRNANGRVLKPELRKLVEAELRSDGHPSGKGRRRVVPPRRYVRPLRSAVRPIRAIEITRVARAERAEPHARRADHEEV